VAPAKRPPVAIGRGASAVVQALATTSRTSTVSMVTPSGAADPDGAVADMAPDCEYIAVGTVPGHAGTYRGPEGYKEFVAWLAEEFSNAHAHVDALIDAGDSVVVGATLRGRGRQSGIPATFTFWQVWTFADGKVVHGQGFADKAEALQAAGLRT